MIFSVQLANFKCFKHLDLVLRPLTILAGLNGMGKSSVIQSLLLIRQSSLSGDLRAGRIALSGELTDLGTGSDILFDGAEEDSIEVGFGLSGSSSGDNVYQVLFRFAYDREADQLANSLGGDEASAQSAALAVAEGQSLPPFSGRFHYVNAERLGPRKMLPLSESHVRLFDIGSRGEYVLHYLLEHGTKSTLAASDPRCSPDSGPTLQDQVDGWLQEISPGCHLDIEHFRRGDIAIPGYTFDRPGDVSTRPFRATNVGFGLSYILPVIVSLLAAPVGALVLLENPEAHIHPRGQTRIGQLAARAASAGVQVIIETHSDHVMDGVRIEVREGRLAPVDAAFHYFQKEGGATTVVSPIIDLDGRLDTWPEGFFDQHDENLASLLAPKS